MKFNNHVKNKSRKKQERLHREFLHEQQMGILVTCPLCRGRNSIARNSEGVVFSMCRRCDGTGQVTKAESLIH